MFSKVFFVAFQLYRATLLPIDFLNVTLVVAATIGFSSADLVLVPVLTLFNSAANFEFVTGKIERLTDFGDFSAASNFD